MAVVLNSTTGGNEGLFNRLGRIFQAIKTILAELDTATSNSIADKINDIYGYFDASPIEIRAAVAGLTDVIADVRSAVSSPVSSLRDVAEATLVTMYDEDSALPVRDLEHALEALVRQMIDGTYYVDPNTVTAAATQTDLTGDGVVVVTTKRGDGLVNQHLIAETARISVTDNTTPGSETLLIQGQRSAGDLLAYDWPIGSGGSRRYTSIDAEGAANLIPNGGFEDFTVANIPDGWTIETGTAGTTVVDEDTDQYVGEHALAIVGDGSQLTELRLPLTMSGFTALANYAINVFARVSATMSGGELTIDLFDGTDVIADEAGNDNELVIDLTALTTDYEAANTTFRFPDPMPPEAWLRIRLSTAADNGKSVILDQLAIAEMQPLARDGRTPDVAIFSGATGWAIDDGGDLADNVFQIAVANNRASEWQTAFERLFDTPSLGIQLPYSGSNLINDSLIA
jgi:hypothetical protein